MDGETFEYVAPVVPDDEEPSRYIGRVYHLDAEGIGVKAKLYTLQVANKIGEPIETDGT